MGGSEFSVVPIVDSFKDQNKIGELRILTAALPSTPDFVLAIGYRALEMGPAPLYQVTRYELVEVSLQSDANYMAYLILSKQQRTANNGDPESTQTSGSRVAGNEDSAAGPG